MSVRSEDDSGRALGASQGFAPTPSSFSNDPQSLMLEELRELKELIGRAAEEPPLKSQAIWTFLLQFFGLLVGTIFGVFAILAWTEGQQANSMASDGNTLASGANEVAQSAYALAVSANSIASHGNDMGRSAYSLAVTANSLASAGIKSASVGNSYASRGAADARVANDFALMAYCSSAPSGNEAICSSIQSLVMASIVSYASSVLLAPTTPINLETTSSTSLSTTSIVTITSKPTVSARPPPTTGNASESQSHKNTGTIVGIAFGSVDSVALFFAAAYLPYRTWKARLKRSEEMKKQFSRSRKR